MAYHSTTTPLPCIIQSCMDMGGTFSFVTAPTVSFDRVVEQAHALSNRVVLVVACLIDRHLVLTDHKNARQNNERLIREYYTLTKKEFSSEIIQNVGVWLVAWG